MKKALIVAGFAVVIGLSFWLGRASNAPSTTPPTQAASGPRKVAYYRCPMHPTVHSDHPGTTPCCGMDFEPVYEGDAVGAPPGIHAAQQSRTPLGIRTVRVERGPFSGSAQYPARVELNELKLYRISAAASGWVRQVNAQTTGSFVQKDEVLAEVYSQEFLGAQQAYLRSMRMLELRRNQRDTPEQLAAIESNVQQTKYALQSLGVSEAQMRALLKDQATQGYIQITAPAAGQILNRNLFAGQRVEIGTELYRIADLSSLWLSVDVPDSALSQFTGRTGRAFMVVKGQERPAHRSTVPPTYDADARTSRVRFEVSNQDLALRPGMLLSLEIQSHPTDSLVVPLNSVILREGKELVYVQQPDGQFAARPVRTGAHGSGEVNVLAGLQEGESIVAEGVFLLDAESQLAQTTSTSATPGFASSVVDPVCGMSISPTAPTTQRAEAQGHAYFFCSKSCRDKFLAAPDSFSAPKRSPDSTAHPGSSRPSHEMAAH